MSASVVKPFLFGPTTEGTFRWPTAEESELWPVVIEDNKILCHRCGQLEETACLWGPEWSDVLYKRDFYARLRTHRDNGLVETAKRYNCRDADMFPALSAQYQRIGVPACYYLQYKKTRNMAKVICDMFYLREDMQPQLRQLHLEYLAGWARESWSKGERRFPSTGGVCLTHFSDFAAVAFHRDDALFWVTLMDSLAPHLSSPFSSWSITTAPDG